MWKLKKIINIWNIDKKTFSIENKTILNTSHIFSNFLGLELTKDVDSAKKVLSILFDKINFFSFTDETITFYEEVFAERLYAFAFSYNDSQKREECKEILNLLENRY